MKLFQACRNTRIERLSAFHKARTWRTAILGLSVTAVLAIGATAMATLPASASPVPSATATAASAFQNKVLDAAMSRVPGGIRVSAGEVEWDGGRVVLGATAPQAKDSASSDATLTCTDGYFCAWGAKNYAGSCWMYALGGTDYEFDWAAYSGETDLCGSAGTWSWKNDTSYRVWKEQDFSGEIPVADAYTYEDGTPSGTPWCIPPGPGVDNHNVSDNITRTLGWIYMSSNPSSC